LVIGKCETVNKNENKCVFAQKLFIDNASKDMLKMFTTCKE